MACSFNTKLSENMAEKAATFLPLLGALDRDKSLKRGAKIENRFENGEA